MLVGIVVGQPGSPLATEKMERQTDRQHHQASAYPSQPRSPPVQLSMHWSVREKAHQNRAEGNVCG